MDAPDQSGSIAETSTAYPTNPQRRILWTALTALAVTSLLGVAALGLAAFFWLHEPKDRTVRLRITAGRAAGERHRIAEVLRREAARRSIFLQVVETAGTEQALREVEAGRLDAALTCTLTPGTMKMVLKGSYTPTRYSLDATSSTSGTGDAPISTSAKLTGLWLEACPYPAHPQVAQR